MLLQSLDGYFVKEEIIGQVEIPPQHQLKFLSEFEQCKFIS